MGSKKKIVDTAKKEPGLARSAPDEIERARRDADLLPDVRISEFPDVQVPAAPRDPQEPPPPVRPPVADEEMHRQSEESARRHEQERDR